MIAPSFIKPRRPDFGRCAIIPVKFGTRRQITSSIVPFLASWPDYILCSFGCLFALGKSAGLSNVGKTGLEVLAGGPGALREGQGLGGAIAVSRCARSSQQCSFSSLSPFLREGRAKSGWSCRGLLMGDPQLGREPWLLKGAAEGWGFWWFEDGKELLMRSHSFLRWTQCRQAAGHVLRMWFLVNS